MHHDLKRPRRPWKFLCLQLELLLAAAAGHCGSISIVVPNDLELKLGNSASSLPFDTGTGTVRYQQVFDASQFGPVGPFPGIGAGGAWVTTLSFRVAYTGQNFDTTLPSVRIDLSTTSKGPDALSPVFAQNVGADDTIVLSGPLSIHAGGPSAGFDIYVPLAHPFFYLPSSGNLLMDVRNFGGGNTTFFDGVFTVGDSVSMVYATPGDGSGSVDSLTGRLNTFGLATLFEVTPVPEPASISLFLCGLGALALVGWRHQVSRRG